MTLDHNKHSFRPTRLVARRGRLALAVVGVTGATLMGASSALALPTPNPQFLLQNVSNLPVAAPVANLEHGSLPVNPAGLPVVGQGGLQTCPTCVPVGSTLALLKGDAGGAAGGHLPLPLP